MPLTMVNTEEDEIVVRHTTEEPWKECEETERTPEVTEKALNETDKAPEETYEYESEPPESPV